ncbi:hypothetical protein ACFU8Q_18805 [Streptomyces sp. NPDC057543]
MDIDRGSPAAHEAVGRCCDLSVDRASVKAGLLPWALLPDRFARW